MKNSSPLTHSEFSNLVQGIDFKKGERIAVAVSGGADSMALTCLLGEWCKVNHVNLTAITVDHGLRREAAEEARQVKKWMNAIDIPHVILKWDGEKPVSNIQGQARIARYSLIAEWCQSNSVQKIFLAHHQGDQAETFLLRLFRGSGVEGLSCMKGQSDYPIVSANMGSISIYRPFLPIPKHRLMATLNEMEQEWIEDPSNDNESFARIKVRKLLRDNDIDGFSTERIAETADRMGRVQSLLQSLTSSLSKTSVELFPLGWADIKLSSLMEAHEEIGLRCLSSLIRHIGGGAYTPRYQRIVALYERLKQPDFAGQTIGGCVLSGRKGDKVMISREIAAISAPVSLMGQKEIVWDGRFILQGLPEAGLIKHIDVKIWQAACTRFPALKEVKLLKVIRDSLPCIIMDGGEVILPDNILGDQGHRFHICPVGKPAFV